MCFGLKIVSSLQQEFAKVQHRTYLWLKLILDLIRKDLQSVTKTGRQKIFDTTPDSVDKAYTAIPDKDTDKEQARKLLQIVCIAIRPLSVKEMSIALTIEAETKAHEDLEEQTDNFSKTWIKSLCGLFVSIIDGRVYLLHQTAKEFLLSQNDPATSGLASDRFGSIQFLQKAQTSFWQTYVSGICD
jgi:hypothetical protein